MATWIVERTGGFDQAITADFIEYEAEPTPDGYVEFTNECCGTSKLVALFPNREVNSITRKTCSS